MLKGKLEVYYCGKGSGLSWMALVKAPNLAAGYFIGFIF